MKTDEQIRARVMRRVYALYWVRQLKKPAPRLLFVGALSLGLASSVSVVQVALNALAMGGVADIATFFIAAFVGTTLWVQTMVLGLVASVGWFAVDALKKVQSAIAPSRETVIAGAQ